jgi:hypothetical protein
MTGFSLCFTCFHKSKGYMNGQSMLFKGVLSKHILDHSYLFSAGNNSVSVVESYQ